MKFMLGSAAFFSVTLTKSSEHVRGMIPLSAPSIDHRVRLAVPSIPMNYDSHPIILQDDRTISAVCGGHMVWLTCMTCRSLRNPMSVNKVRRLDRDVPVCPSL